MNPGARWRRSLPFRIGALTAGLFGLLVVLLGSGVFVAVSQGLHRTLDENLVRAVETLIPRLEEPFEEGAPDDLPAALQRPERDDEDQDSRHKEDELAELEEDLLFFAFLPANVHIQIARSDGKLLYRSPSLGTRAIPFPREIKPALPVTLRAISYSGETRVPPFAVPRVPSLRGYPALLPPQGALRAVFYTVPTDDGPDVVIAGAVATETVRTVLVGIRRSLIAAVVTALTLVGLGSALLTKKAFQPVRAIIDTVEAVDEDSLDTRIKTGTRDDTLERLVNVLNRMLDRLETAFRVRRKFVDDASHELRTPLTSLRGEIDLALRRPRTPDEYEAALARALEEVDHLIDLTEALLQIVRSGRSVRLKERVDLKVVAAEALQRCRSQSEDAGILLIDRVSPGLTVLGDRLALERVLVNLITNGVQACERGGRVELAAELQERRGKDGVAITVSDTGVGIPADEAERIFDRFYQSREAQTGGTGASGRAGLGLAIVREIVQAHGGSVEVRSAPGKGSRFTVWIPSGM